jgi:hypothetical protein
MDLGEAGDLLPHFGLDFFHDGWFELTVPSDDRVASMKITAIVSSEVDGSDDGQIEVEFLVEFLDLARLVIEIEPEFGGLSGYGYSEIDGLTDWISEADAAHGPGHHSLVIQCPGGWVSLVFRSVRVAPTDPVLWMRVLRDPTSKLHIYGLNEASVDG